MIQLSKNKEFETIGIFEDGKFIGEIYGTLVKTGKSYKDGTTEYIIMLEDEQLGYILASKEMIKI